MSDSQAADLINYCMSVAELNQRIQSLAEYQSFAEVLKPRYSTDSETLLKISNELYAHESSLRTSRFFPGLYCGVQAEGNLKIDLLNLKSIKEKAELAYNAAKAISDQFSTIYGLPDGYQSKDNP